MHKPISDLTPEVLLGAYAQGIFPMADSATEDEFFWVIPKARGIIPLNQFYLSKRLKRTIRSDCYEVRIDQNFSSVIAACAEQVENREETWINTPIRQACEKLFEIGHAHSVETYNETGQLVGGLYGVSLGGAFFGESMFHRAPNASKVALAHLVGRLIMGGFTLLDTQFLTDHLSQFGTLEISQKQYVKQLNEALAIKGDWYKLPINQPISGCAIINILEKNE